MKNGITKNRRLNASNENIEESQQVIKFFEVLLSKIIIRRSSNNL